MKNTRNITRSKLGVHRILNTIRPNHIPCRSMIIVIQFKSLKPEVYLNIPKFSPYFTEKKASPLRRTISNCSLEKYSIYLENHIKHAHTVWENAKRGGICNNDCINTWVISKVLHTVCFLFKNEFILQNTFTGLQCNLHCALPQWSNVLASLVFLSGSLRCWCVWLLRSPH
jgi:hypothetical protein